MTSVVAKALADGRLAVRLDPDTTLETPVYVATSADATPGKSTPITFTATDARTGEHKSVVRSLLRAMNRLYAGSGARTLRWRFSRPRPWHRSRERPQMSGELTGRHVVAILGLFFFVMFAANIALIYFALHTLRGSELENPYDASQAYNGRIAEARAQAERGWKVNVMTRAEGAGERIMVEFRNRDGGPIPDLEVTARFEHPFDAALDRESQRLHPTVSITRAWRRPSDRAAGSW